jgi:hypothetical protein
MMTRAMVFWIGLGTNMKLGFLSRMPSSVSSTSQHCRNALPSGVEINQTDWSVAFIVRI